MHVLFRMAGNDLHSKYLSHHHNGTLHVVGNQNFAEATARSDALRIIISSWIIDRDEPLLTTVERDPISSRDMYTFNQKPKINALATHYSKTISQRLCIVKIHAWRPSKIQTFRDSLIENLATCFLFCGLQRDTMKSLTPCKLFNTKFRLLQQSYLHYQTPACSVNPISVPGPHCLQLSCRRHCKNLDNSLTKQSLLRQAHLQCVRNRPIT